ncbi:unnamed protein product [Pedinophyceae sp. YPF-701]|nr:unnamed protein product [Pedinophyceae sp. YPF-701]
MIFGKKALEDRNPAGMKRLSEDDAPEMYPATTTEFADPVESDDSTMAVLRPMLARTQLERRPLRLAFDSEEHGWSAREFHARVDTFGAGIVLAETQGGAVCGGYNPRGWVGLGEDRDAIAAFLFTWPDGDTSKPAIKLPKVGGPSMAVVDKPDSGPQFGAEGLTIPLTPGKERVARSRLGTFYSRIDASKKRDLFAPDEDWKGTTLTRLRVYVGAGKGEEWELDGIVWKSKVDE